MVPVLIQLDANCFRNPITHISWVFLGTSQPPCCENEKLNTPNSQKKKNSIKYTKKRGREMFNTTMFNTPNSWAIFGKKIGPKKIDGFTLSPRSTQNRVKQNVYLLSDGGGKSGGKLEEAVIGTKRRERWGREKPPLVRKVIGGPLRPAPPPGLFFTKRRSSMSIYMKKGGAVCQASLKKREIELRRRKKFVKLNEIIRYCVLKKLTIGEGVCLLFEFSHVHAHTHVHFVTLLSSKIFIMIFRTYSIGSAKSPTLTRTDYYLLSSLRCLLALFFVYFWYLDAFHLVNYFFPTARHW